MFILLLVASQVSGIWPYGVIHLHSLKGGICQHNCIHKGGLFETVLEQVESAEVDFEIAYIECVNTKTRKIYLITSLNQVFWEKF